MISALQPAAEFLDERVPGWHDRIDLDRLDIASIHDCILGQLYGNYGKGQEALGINVWDYPQVMAAFCLAGNDDWRAVIRARRLVDTFNRTLEAA